MRKVIASILLVSMLSACSTAGGWYSEGDPVNGDFSVWKSAGAVVLGAITLGMVGAAAYAGAQDSGPTYTTTYVTPSYGYSGSRTYFVNGTMVTCYGGPALVTCY